MADEVYRGSIHIDAEPEFVYRYFTQADALVRWMGDSAIVEPRPGGRFSLAFGDRTVEGRYVELDPPNRLVISWGRDGSPSFPPASSTLEVTLTPEDGGTRVSIFHARLPVSEVQRHAIGWRHYLARLAAVAAGLEVAEHVVPEQLTEGVD